MTNDRRLIEDYLPIQAISAEASREKSIRKGHISTLHLWWARRPLVACRAAVYGALVPAHRFRPKNGPEEKRDSLMRANAAKFVKRLCRYPSDSKPEEKADINRAIKEAQRHILEDHAERLSQETGKKVTVEDIEEGRASRPKVLDMFAGGGAIPLEALRLGCEAYALDLNPVAHIIELCTLVYPQKYGKPDLNARGMIGPKNDKGETTWGGLAEEVRYWGNWVLEKVKAEIGDLYPLIPDPEYKGHRPKMQAVFWKASKKDDIPLGFLVPAVYLWTRTVTCKNQNCRAAVPLSKMQWIRRERKDKPGRYIALNRRLDKSTKRVSFLPVEAAHRSEMTVPEISMKAGNVACPFCGSVNDEEYVKAEGRAGRMFCQLMAVGATRQDRKGKIYVGSNTLSEEAVLNSRLVEERLTRIVTGSRLNSPDEPVVRDGKQSVWVDLYGLTHFGKIFLPRQLAVGLSCAHRIHESYDAMIGSGVIEEHARAVSACLAMALDRHMNQNNTLTIFNAQGETIEGAVNDKTLPMAWDFPEPNPFSGLTGSLQNAVSWVVNFLDSITREEGFNCSAEVVRGSATNLMFGRNLFDAIVTDPPYYDNVSYAAVDECG